jgi:hypothetical protein
MGSTRLSKNDISVDLDLVNSAEFRSLNFDRFVNFSEPTINEFRIDF